MARVNGRIVLLILSINTINGINAIGVLWGTKWANISLLNLIHPNIIIPSHKGIANDNEIDICLVGVKMYGKSPVKLLIKININKDIRIILKYLLEFTIILNSLWRLYSIELINILVTDDFSQNLFNKSDENKINAIQFIEIFPEVEGSNEENKLVIMISLFEIYLSLKNY